MVFLFSATATTESSSWTASTAPSTAHRNVASRTGPARREEPVRAAPGHGRQDVGRRSACGARVGGHGLPALLHHRLRRRRTRRARRGVDVGVHVALPLLPQPGYLEDR